VASVVIQNLGLDLSHAENALKQIIKPGTTDQASTGRRDLPYTSRAKKTIEFAMIEARELNHSYVGTEHLLLGLMREEKNIGAQVLYSMGVTVDKARAETRRILGDEIGAPLLSPPEGEKPNHIGLTLRYSNGAVVNLNFNDPGEAARYLTSQ